MANLSAKIRFRDGQTRNINISVENNLSSLNDGINNLNENVTQLLSELVEREKGARAQGEEEDSDDEDFLQTQENLPPAKKHRT